MTIEINVAERRATIQGEPVIVCGNSDYAVHFTFDEEWAAEETKTARFVYTADGETGYTDVVFTGDTVNVPVLSSTHEVLVGVFVGNRMTTTPAVIPCETSIRCL